jgi:hypothetical protein
MANKLYTDKELELFSIDDGIEKLPIKVNTLNWKEQPATQKQIDYLYQLCAEAEMKVNN